MLLKMAFRNLLRNKRRTFLTGLMMIGGYTLVSITLALVDGSYDQVISIFTKQHVGHVQVVHKDFVENPTLHKTVKDYLDKMNEIKKNKEVRAVAPRIYGDALLYFKNKTFGAEVVGISPHLESKATQYTHRIIEGRGFKIESDEYEAILGKKLAKILNIKVGRKLILISQSADGSIANDIFKIVGIIGTEEEGKDDYRVYLPLKIASEFFFLRGRVHELSIHLQKIDMARRFTKKLETLDKQLTIRPWQDVERDFYKAMMVDKKGNNVSIFILILMVGVGVLNTILMSTLERTREFGVLKAIGTLPKQLFGLILTEGMILSGLSSFVGMLISFGLNFYLSKNGIIFDEPISYGGVTINEMRSQISISSYFYPALLVILTTFVASLYPGIKTSQIGVSEALREN